jgi:frataxin-like iron-binding protein CyaY
VAANGGGEALFYEGNKWTQPIDVVKNTVVKIDQNQYGRLTSISCASVYFCIAVASNGYEYTFRNGTWSTGLQIDKTSLDYGSLNTVSCPSNKFCVAGDFNGFVFTYLDGLWTSGIQIVKNQNHTMSINSVDCPKNNFCIAVDNSGYAYTYSHGEWSVPNHIDKYGGLVSISCSTVRNCKAIDDVFSYVFSFDNGNWSKLIKLENGNY